MSTPKNTTRETRMPLGTGGTRGTDPIEPEALRALALSLSNLVAHRSRNPRVSAAAKFISNTLNRP